MSFFVIALVFILGYIVFSNINNEFQESGVISTQGKEMSSELMTRYPNLFDKMFMFILLGLGLGVIAGAYFIPSHPALFFISIPILAFIIWLGGLYANIFYEITNHAEIATLAKDFPITLFVFNNYVMIIMVYILVLAIALYAKQRVGGAG